MIMAALVPNGRKEEYFWLGRMLSLGCGLLLAAVLAL